MKEMYISARRYWKAKSKWILHEDITSYSYKLVCVEDKLSKFFKPYLGENAVYNFINSMIEESKYCSEVMKKHFNKELVMTKEDNEYFENPT